VEEHYRVWKRLAPLGLLLVGAGTAVTCDAATQRAAGSGATRWVGEGTAGLVLLNAGLSLFGEAVKRRALYDVGTGVVDRPRP
jgi:hypothetical protein